MFRANGTGSIAVLSLPYTRVRGNSTMLCAARTAERHDHPRFGRVPYFPAIAQKTRLANHALVAGDTHTRFTADASHRFYRLTTGLPNIPHVPEKIFLCRCASST